MGSQIEDVTFEISTLEQEIQRLEMEINSQRHSTANVPRHSNRQPVAGTPPVRSDTFSQLADHNLAGHIPMVSQFGRADHLTDHTGCHGTVVNESD
jgi:hypothetical protein